MEDPDISTNIRQFNAELKRDANNFMRREINALQELKKKFASEHEQKEKLLKRRHLLGAPNDVKLTFQSIEDFNRQKQQLKVDAEVALERFYKNRECSLGKVFDIMLQKFIKKVDETSLASEDFKKSPTSLSRNTICSGTSWQFYPVTDDDDETDIIRPSPSPVNNQRPVKRKINSGPTSLGPVGNDRPSKCKRNSGSILRDPVGNHKSVKRKRNSGPISFGSDSESSVETGEPPRRRPRIQVPTSSGLWTNKAGGLWMPLISVSDKVSGLPSAYQLKVYQAKKPAFIGCCANLQTMVSKYQNGISTGNKQLDNYIKRNLHSIEIKSEVCPFLYEAKKRCEEMLNDFTTTFSKCPIYNN